MGWLIALAVLFLLGCLPLGVKGIYDTSGFLAQLLIGPVKLPLYPGKEKKEKKEQPQEKPAAPVKKEPAKEEEKKGGSWTDFLAFIPLALDLLDDLRLKMRIKRLEMHLYMAGGDPCDLAINYGKAWAYVESVMPLLEQVFVIKKRDIRVSCDFTECETTVYVRADATITLARLLGLVFRYGIPALKEYFKIIMKRNGGASK